MNSALFRRVLVVDDELNIVNAVRRELCTPPLGRYRYDAEGFSDPVQALERARVQEFDAVISDYRMPGMSGLEFLKALALLQPHCARIVLSGQTDMAALIKMVNETHIYFFVPKPWHDYYLKSSVAQSIEFAGALRESRRLAGVVRGRGIAVPSLLGEEPEGVLIVGGELTAVSSLARALSSHNETDNLFAAIRFEMAHVSDSPLQESRIQVTMAASAREALKLAEARTFSCVLADFKLPDMSGVEFLQQFAECQPDCGRILVGGQIAQDDLVDAVDAAHIFGFIGKPWQDYELKACVAQALAYQRVSLESRILAEMVKKAGGAV
jgi:DNA-binding NtrC family response regulator